jgi:luciferase family oxidoreductase group 1
MTSAPTDEPDRSLARLTLPRSVLDLSTVSSNRTSAQALADTTTLAQRAEELGYLRFWVAEHHNMATVASTSPPVLMAHLGASTSSIRIGSGGVMLPNHAPLVVAEQFAMLEALHPGRVDLGIGRAPGTDPATAAALRRTTNLGAEDFPRDLLDLMGLLGDERVEHGAWSRFRATPVATSSPQIILLGSSGYSAQIAGQLGLGFGFAHHFDQGGVLQACELYRDSFRPSPELAEPYTLVTASVLAAQDPEQAEHLAGPARLAILGIRTNRRMPLLPPDEAAVHPDIEVARSMPSTRIVDDGPGAVARLMDLAEQTQASELMISTMTYGLPERIRTLELLAEHWPPPVEA